MPRKKPRPTIDCDSTSYSTVISCPLCNHRAMALDKSMAWRMIYRHIRAFHNTPHAAAYSRMAYRNFQRNQRRRG